MNIAFTFLESLQSETFPEILPRIQLCGTKHETKGVDQWKLRCTKLIFSLVFIFPFGHCLRQSPI